MKFKLKPCYRRALSFVIEQICYWGFAIWVATCFFRGLLAR